MLSVSTHRTNPDGLMLCRTENFIPYHEKIKEFLCDDDSKLVRVVSELLGDEALVYKEKINYKLPNGSGFKAHQV